MDFQCPCFPGNKFKKRENGKVTRVDVAKTFINTDHFMVHITVFPTTSHILQSQTGQSIHNKIQSKRPDFQLHELHRQLLGRNYHNVPLSQEAEAPF